MSNGIIDSLLSNPICLRGHKFILDQHRLVALENAVDIEHALHFYFERAKALELKFGPAPIHLKALEAELGM